MLKTLKWVYELGYKHAEEKYYHALVLKAVGIQPTQFEMFGIEDKSGYTKENLLQRQNDARQLQQLVESVFHPIEYVSPEAPRRVNRFEP